MRGSGCSTASRWSLIGRNGSYSTAIRSRAAVATSSLTAATPATGSPTKRALSSASACSSWLTGRIPNGIGRSFPVSTALTPGRARACAASTRTMRACGCGLCSSLLYSMRGRERSSANFVTPRTLAVASTLRSAFPTTRRAVGRSAAFLPRAIQRLPCRLCALTPQTGRGQLHRLVDLDVAGAAAEVARQGLLDLVAVGARVVGEEGVGGEEEGWGAVAALGGAQHREGFLQRVEPAALRQPFHRLHAAALAREAEHQARQHGRAVEQHRARSALTQFAPVLRASEGEILPQHLEQRLVRSEGDLDRAQAVRLLKTVPLIDGHNDIPDAIRERGGLDSVDFAASQPKLMTDIPRLRAGGVGGQFWSAYVPVTTIHGGEHPAVYALEQIDLVHRLCRKYPQTFAEATTAAAVERNFKAGKISCLIGIEGGHAIENSLGALRMFFRLGVRYMTLTHWETIDWADAATDSAKHNGLTPFGEDVVREMNRLGMLVDLSHVSDATMVDAIRVSRAPVLFSHSSARALCDHVRNVPDSILKMVRANGGVVMVNFNPAFVSEAVRGYEDSMVGRARALRAAGADSGAVADSLQAGGARAPKAAPAQGAGPLEHIRAGGGGGGGGRSAHLLR